MVAKEYLTSAIFSILNTLNLNNNNRKFQLNDHFYFDPVTMNKCDHTNYWTPYYRNTTCFRWFSLEPNDTESKSTIKIILDHNMFYDTYDKIPEKLKELGDKWKRLNSFSKLNLPEENIIFDIVGYLNKPNLEELSVVPPYGFAEYYMNSYFIYNGTKTNEGGYWTKDSFEHNDSYAYCFGISGKNELILKTQKRGIRPVLIIQKMLLKVIPPPINMEDILENATIIKFPSENISHEGSFYRQLQSATVTNDRFIFTSNDNRDTHCMIYSYKGKNFETLANSLYDACGHSNGATYNTKTKKVIVLGPGGQLMEYSLDLTPEAVYRINESYPGFSGIGYCEEFDYYVGYSSKKIYFSKTTDKFPYQYLFYTSTFETTQDIEYHDGYVFQPIYDMGAPSSYQKYSFFGAGNSILYIFNAKLDKNGNPTKDFGRMVARLTIVKRGEIEAMSVRNGTAYLGFAYFKDNPFVFRFYAFNYQNFKKRFAPETNNGKTLNIKFNINIILIQFILILLL